MKTILVRYDEIALKSRPVRRKFERILVRNIERAISGTEFELRRNHGRIFINTPMIEENTQRLAKIPGIVSVSPSWMTDSKLDNIASKAVALAEVSFSKIGTFAVRARRLGEHDFSSRDINEKVGAELLKAYPGLSVDLDSPNQEIFVEVRGNDAYLFTRMIKGIGGLPVGSQKGSVIVFSGDASSLASAFLMLKRGSPIYPIFFCYQGKNTEKKALEAAECLAKFSPKLKLLIFPLDPVIEEIEKNVFKEIARATCERIIFRFAEMIAEEMEAEAIVTSDMALESHALPSWKAIEEGVQIPVLRPLIGFDEEEVKKMAAEVGVMEPSLERSPWCRIFPASQKEKITPNKIKEAEKLLPIEDLFRSLRRSVEVKKFW